MNEKNNIIINKKEQEQKKIDRKKKFDVYQYPPLIKLCEEHLKSSNFNNTVDTKKSCKCCGYPTNIQEFTMKENVDNFAENGSGYSLFFWFYRFSFIFLVFPILLSSIYYIIDFSKGDFCSKKNNSDIITHKNSPPNETKKQLIHDYCLGMIFFKDEFCNKYKELNCHNNFSNQCNELANFMLDVKKSKSECDPTYYNILSFANKLKIGENQQTTNIGYIVDMITGVIILLMFYFWHELEEYKILHYDKINLTMSDFTVQIEGLPKKIMNTTITEYKTELKRFLETPQMKNERNYKVIDINIAFNLEKFDDLMNHIQNQENILKKKITHNNEENIPIIHHDKKEILKKNDFPSELLGFEHKVKTDSWNELSGIIFVTFSTEEIANQFIKKYKSRSFNIMKYLFKKPKSKLTYKYNNIIYNLKVIRANEPTDITWKNLHYTNFERFYRNIVSKISIIILSIIFFVFILWLTFLNQYFNSADNDGSTSNFIMSLLTSQLIVIFNVVFSIFIKFFISFEKNKTVSKNLSSEIKSIYRFQLFNSSMPFLVSAILRLNFFGDNGLIVYLNLFYLSNIFLPPLIDYFGDVMYFYKLYLRYKIRKSPKNCKLVQEDAQLVFENSQFDISSRYAFILLNISVSLIYFPIFPLSPIYCILSLFIKYFFDKYILIKRSNKKIEYSNEMSENISSEFKWFFLYYAFGIIIKDVIISYWDNDDPEISTFSYIIFGFGLINFIFDFPKIFSKMHKDKKTKFEGKYDIMANEYPFNYYMTNSYYVLKEELDELTDIN